MHQVHAPNARNICLEAFHAPNFFEGLAGMQAQSLRSVDRCPLN